MDIYKYSHRTDGIMKSGWFAFYGIRSFEYLSPIEHSGRQIYIVGQVSFLPKILMCNKKEDSKRTCFGCLIIRLPHSWTKRSHEVALSPMSLRDLMLTDACKSSAPSFRLICWWKVERWDWVKLTLKLLKTLFCRRNSQLSFSALNIYFEAA